MNLLILVLLLLLLFGAGGFYIGGPVVGGSGLGLAIAAELVRAHGGDIHLVEGTIGATFRISIPDRPVELQSVRNERARA